MIFHANANDGIPHVHDCPIHPPYSTAGGLACFWYAHSEAWQAEHLSQMIAGLRDQLKREKYALHRINIELTLLGLEDKVATR